MTKKQRKRRDVKRAYWKPKRSRGSRKRPLVQDVTHAAGDANQAPPTES